MSGPTKICFFCTSECNLKALFFINFWEAGHIRSPFFVKPPVVLCINRCTWVDPSIRRFQLLCFYFLYIFIQLSFFFSTINHSEVWVSFHQRNPLGGRLYLEKTMLHSGTFGVCFSGQDIYSELEPDFSLVSGFFKNMPAAQAAGADPSRYSSSNRQNPPIHQNRRNFWTSNAIWMPFGI